MGSRTQYNRFFIKSCFATFISLLFFFSAKAVSHEEQNAYRDGTGVVLEEKYDVKEHTFHHLLDQYYWDFYTKEDGTPVRLGLPRILYTSARGLEFFCNTEAAEHAGYAEAHHYDENAKHGDLVWGGDTATLNSLQAKAAAEPGNAAAKKAFSSALSAAKPWDFSITKNVLYMFIAFLLICLIFIFGVAPAYKRREGQAPKGIQSLFEPIIVFVRDDIAKENIGGHKYYKFMPLLLTMFFFILFLNLLGMTPFSGNVSGNISFTLALSLVTLIAVSISGNKNYWKHIFNPPVPAGVKPIIVPLEILSIFTKPAALTIRLFANISGGHIIMISLLSLIFIFGENGRNLVAGYGVGLFSTLFIVAIGLLEIFVAFLQAYVFTMLTAVFIGQAVEEAHH